MHPLGFFFRVDLRQEYFYMCHIETHSIHSSLLAQRLFAPCQGHRSSYRNRLRHPLRRECFYIATISKHTLPRLSRATIPPLRILRHFLDCLPTAYLECGAGKFRDFRMCLLMVEAQGLEPWIYFLFLPLHVSVVLWQLGHSASKFSLASFALFPSL